MATAFPTTFARTRNRTPKYRRQKEKHGPDRAFVELNGKRIHLGEWNSRESRQEYDRLIAEWLSNNRMLPVSVPQDELTIIEVAARFWVWAEGYYRTPDGNVTGELGNYRDALRPLKQLYGNKSASDFGPKALTAVRQWMIEQGWARTYINRTISRILAVFRWAVSEELIEPAVYQRLAAVKGLRKGRSEAIESEPVVPVSDGQIDAIRKLVATQVESLIDLQALTGARPGELLKLRAIDINTTTSPWTHKPVQHKTAHHGSQRTIYFGPKAQAILSNYITGRPVDAYLFSPREAEQDRHAKAECHRRRNQQPNERETDRVVGDHYTSATYRRAIARACDKAFLHPELSKLPFDKLTAEQRITLRQWKRDHRWHPHQLRHLAATKLREQFGLDVAQTILGHRVGSSITEIYAEPATAKAQDAILKVG